MEIESEHHEITGENEGCFPPLNFIRKVYTKYDSTFVTLLIAQYFNQGFKVLISLASADAFKTVYNL